jgi:hypothetical protein
MSNKSPIPRRKAGAGPTQRDQALQQRKEILHQWRTGVAISQIARERSIARSVISWLLEQEGARDEQADSRAARRTVRKQSVLEWVRRNPGSTTMDASLALGINHRTIANYLIGEAEQSLIVEKRTRGRQHTRDAMLQHLQHAWRHVPDDRRRRGLSKGLFIAFSAGGAPSPALYEKRFRTWRQACLEAGVPSPEAYRSYSRRFDEDALLDALELFMKETGETSFAAYSAWARDRKGSAPSGPLVINRFGRWSAARRRLLDRQRSRAA